MSESHQTHEAREALAVNASAAAAGRAAARRYLRRYLLGLGVVFAVWLLGLVAISQWLTVGSTTRAAIVGVSVAALVGLALMPARVEPVRARLGGRARVVTTVGGGLLFGVLAALSSDFPVVAAVGALVVFAYWAVCAWWFGRAG
jgi:hypothetical protein